MKLNDYLIIFISVGLIGVLLIASPAIASIFSLPAGESYSELYLLGPQKMADNYPFNINVNQNYSVFLNVENHMGSSVYYIVYVKFGNLTDSLPDSVLGIPSSLLPLNDYRFSIPDADSWQNLVTFSFSNALILGNSSQINTLRINGFAFNVDKPAYWDSNSTTFRYQLLFELWSYNSITNMISYNNCFANLQLNLTTTI